MTRPEPAASRTLARLTEAGWSGLVAPVLVHAATGEPAPDGPFDALVATSAAAFRSDVPELARWVGLPVFAVGRRSAEAARRAGFGDVRDGGGDAAALRDLIARSLPPGSRLLHVAGRDRKPEPERSLREDGFAVRPWVVYAAEPVRALPEAARSALEAGRIAAVLHYSRRSADTLRRLADAAGLDLALARAGHVCLSADVAAALSGLPHVTMADAPDEDALLQALPRALRRREPGSPAPQSGC